MLVVLDIAYNYRNVVALTDDSIVVFHYMYNKSVPLEATRKSDDAHSVGRGIYRMSRSNLIWLVYKPLSRQIYLFSHNVSIPSISYRSSPITHMYDGHGVFHVSDMSLLDLARF